MKFLGNLVPGALLLATALYCPTTWPHRDGGDGVSAAEAACACGRIQAQL